MHEVAQMRENIDSKIKAIGEAKELDKWFNLVQLINLPLSEWEDMDSFSRQFLVMQYEEVMKARMRQRESIESQKQKDAMQESTKIRFIQEPPSHVNKIMGL